LKQRFCSLFGEARTASGQTVAELTVSTADDGRPAALLRLPLGVRLARGVDVAAVSAPQGFGADRPGPQKRASPLRLRLLRCDAQGCMTLLPLTPRDIAVLDAGGGLSLRFVYASERPAWPALRSAADDVSVTARIDGAGFHDAVAASMR
jgi:invasion protein IalB